SSSTPPPSPPPPPTRALLPGDPAISGRPFLRASSSRQRRSGRGASDGLDSIQRRNPGPSPAPPHAGSRAARAAELSRVRPRGGLICHSPSPLRGCRPAAAAASRERRRRRSSVRRPTYRLGSMLRASRELADCSSGQHRARVRTQRPVRTARTQFSPPSPVSRKFRITTNFSCARRRRAAL
ncbi:unnamed protein product, partial [Urochloa humidicola]